MLSLQEAFRLTRFSFSDLAESARATRDDLTRHRITFSPKVFLPLTHLCQDSCSYCAFAESPAATEKLYLSLDDVAETCMAGNEYFCAEALFTLGELPEKRYDVAQQWLRENGYESTIDYLTAASKVAMTQYGLLPHVNPGAISEKDLRKLKPVSASQGMMLETIAGRLSEPGGPHFGSPDKSPARRLATLESAGRAKVPFTTGILIGIGETREERIQALVAIRDLHAQYGHIQEVIVQNFVPKDATGMASAPPASEEEHLWSIAAARLIFGPTMHIQAPPNLVTSSIPVIDAGVDDLGGISPITKDYVNPEKPWPSLHDLKEKLHQHGYELKARAAIYPEFIHKEGFVDENVVPYIAQKVDDSGYLTHSPLEFHDNNEAPPTHTRGEKKAVTEHTGRSIRRTTHTPQRVRQSNLPTSRPH
jgi:FO synthase